MYVMNNTTIRDLILGAKVYFDTLSRRKVTPKEKYMMLALCGTYTFGDFQKMLAQFAPTLWNTIMRTKGETDYKQISHSEILAYLEKFKTLKQEDFIYEGE